MAFIGNTNTTQAFTPAVDYFSGNGSTTAFTLSRPVASVAQVQAVVNNVAQNPSSAFTVSGNTITFTSAPSSGTNNIYVYYTSPITQVIAPGQGTVGTTSLSPSLLVPPAMVSDQNNTSTGYFDLPVGTTAQRPGSPGIGMMRYNTTINAYEGYTNIGWEAISTVLYSASYLVVAGGGGGGWDWSGGGGAGGLLTGTATLTQGSSYTVTIGAGGAAATSVNVKGSNGANSVAFSSTATGGGGGGSDQSDPGSSGGSGGGGAIDGGGGSGTLGQGNAGAAGNRADSLAGGGGGGASAAGSGTSGGAGTASAITGSSVTYAGGGGGGRNGTAGTGGSGGGGNGGNGANAGVTAGTVNRGGGGGGGGAGQGAAGGSGVVILSIPTAYYSGTTTGSPTVTTFGSNTILTFTGSGSYTA